MDIGQIDEMLRQGDKSWNVAHLGQVLMEILKTNPTMTLAEIEERLRAIGSKTFLVARPLKEMPKGLVSMQYPSGLPGQTWVWICLHGEAERDALLAEIGSDGATENMHELAYCGFCMTNIPTPAILAN